MAKRLMYVEGADGQVELLADRVVIHRAGWWNVPKYGFNARREIPLSAISEVAFKPSGMLVFGEIEFVRSGRSTDEKSKKDHSVVKFGRKKNHEFEMLKEKIFVLIEQYARQVR